MRGQPTTQPRVRGLLGLTILLSLAGMAQADVPFRATFEDQDAKAWDNGEKEALKIVAVPRDDGKGTCLSVSGKGVWISATTKLPKPVPMDGPVYVTADVRSLGPCGSVSLLMADRGEFTYYRTGPMRYDAKHGWLRAIWKADGYFCDYIDNKVVLDEGVLIDGLKFAQRVAGGYDQGPDGPAHHEMRIDNVEVHTGADAEKVARECAERAAQRQYDGPQAFVLSDNDGLAVWHAPSMAKIFQDHRPPKVRGESIQLAMARREAESFQIVLKSARLRNRLWIRLSALTSEDGKSTISPF